MTLSRSIRYTLLAATASTAALAFASAAQAQDAAPSSDSTSSQSADDSGDIIVTGLRASIEASLNAKRKSDMVSEVITAQDIGKFPDKNVADSLGRLTGVNVVTGTANAGGFGENSNVSIRGTDPALNLTLIDGHGIATGDWFVLDQTNGGRSIDLGLLPSEIVGRLEVYKSSQADLPEGGIGGTVNVHLRKPLDLKAWSVAVTAQENYNDLAGKWTPQVSGLVSWKNDAETFGVLASAFYQKRSFRRDGQEFLGYIDVADFNGTGQTVTAPALIGSAYFTQQRIRKGGTLAIQFKPSDRLEIDLNGVYSRMDANNVNRNSMMWVSNLLGCNSTPGVTPPGCTSGYALDSYTIENGYLTAASWNNTDADGRTPNGRVQDDIFRQAYSSTWDINADLTWQASDHLKLTGQLGYTKGKGATSDTYAWETYWHTGAGYALNGKGAAVTYPGLPSDTTSAAYLDNYYSWSWGGKIVSPDSELYGKLDAEYDFDGGFLKSIAVGGRYTDHKRSLNYTAYAWAGNTNSGFQTINLGTVFDGDTTPSDYGDSIGNVTGYSFADSALVLQQLATQGGRQFAFYPQASFSVKEKTQAAYAMARFDDDSHWRGNIGVRAVHTDQQTLQYSPNATVANATSIFCGTCGSVTTDRSYWDILPSANLTYTASDDIVLRAAAAKVMSRPGYAQLAGAFTADDLSLAATSGGNPNLDPYRAWTFNLAAEWYYAPRALLSVNLFYLDIQSYITSSTGTIFLKTLQHPDGATFSFSGPINGPGGKNKGIEINWQQPIWKGFGLIANYTYADAKKEGGGPIEGNSHHTYNLTGYYEDSLISARLAYTFRSKFFSGYDRNTEMWQDNFGSLDGSVLVNVTKNVALSVDAQNLTNSKLYYYVGDPSIPKAYYSNGRTFWVGAKLNF